MMHFALFYHSLISDWNHGNAHFLRGVVTELLRRGHRVTVFEPQAGWSITNLRRAHGDAAIRGFQQAFPHLHSHTYDPAQRDLASWLDRTLDDVDVTIVHEWNETPLIRAIGEHRQRQQGRNSYRALFHDTHHRALSDDRTINDYRLLNYDGVLAFGRVVQDLYLQHEWAQQAWIWHEAADTAIFYPRPTERQEGDLIWIGNWGDNERTARLQEFLFDPAQALGLTTVIHGVRYPLEARQKLQQAGIAYRGWLPNYLVPETFARFRLTVHIPRQPYVEALPGIPTIRVFEALACGIPLICSPWDDCEGLFTPGKDYLVVQHGAAMQGAMRMLLHDEAAAAALAEQGRATVLARHTCAHRVDELLAICAALGVTTAPTAVTPAATTSARRARDKQQPRLAMPLRAGTVRPTPPQVEHPGAATAGQKQKRTAARGRAEHTQHAAKQTGNGTEGDQ
jgi:spore maturation protein CgeB